MGYQLKTCPICKEQVMMHLLNTYCSIVCHQEGLRRLREEHKLAGQTRRKMERRKYDEDPSKTRRKGQDRRKAERRQEPNKCCVEHERRLRDRRFAERRGDTDRRQIVERRSAWQEE